MDVCYTCLVAIQESTALIKRLTDEKNELVMSTKSYTELFFTGVTLKDSSLCSLCNSESNIKYECIPLKRG